MLSVYWVQSPSSNSDSNLSHIPSMTYLNLSPISMSTKPCQPMSTTSSPVLSTYSSALNLMDEEILNSPPTQIQTPIPQSSSQISILNSVLFCFFLLLPLPLCLLRTRLFNFYRVSMPFRLSRQALSQIMETIFSWLARSFKALLLLFNTKPLILPYHLILICQLLLSLLHCKIQSIPMQEM